MIVRKMGAVDHIGSYEEKRRGKIRKVKRGNRYDEAKSWCTYVLIERFNAAKQKQFEVKIMTTRSEAQLKVMKERTEKMHEWNENNKNLRD